MKYLFFDTETTGLPKDYMAPTTDVDNWPRMIQLGWILDNEMEETVSEGNEYVFSPDLEIEAEAAEKNGLTFDFLKENGKPVAEVLRRFMEDFEKADVIVGHNVGFDKCVVGAELVRLGMGDVMKDKPSVCTMLSTVDYLKLPNKPGKTGYKWPRLMELHKFLFGCEFEGAHDAMADIRATEKCYWELRFRKKI